MENKVTTYILVMLWLSVLVSTCGFVSASGLTRGLNTLQFTCMINNQVPSNSATFNFSMYYQNGSVLLDNVQANPNGQGSFNYTINLQAIETYTLKERCYDGLSNSSVQENITVGSTGNPLTFNLLIFLFIGGFLFLILSLFGNEEFFIFCSGIAFLLGGISSLIYGFGDLVTWYTQAIGLVGIGLGILLMFQSYSGDNENTEEEYE